MSADSDLQFVDTNILVYAYDSSSPEKKQVASRLLMALWENRTACLSVQVLQEFYVTMTRKVPAPITSEIAAELIRDLAVWNVHSPDSGDILAAIEIQQQHQLSFWDAMILQSAAALGCRVLWSEDLNDGQVIQGVQIRNPFK
jgi:predicted nucleic acid-binding protein